MDVDKNWGGEKSSRQSWTSMRQRIVDHYVRKIRCGRAVCIGIVLFPVFHEKSDNIVTLFLKQICRNG